MTIEHVLGLVNTAIRELKETDIKVTESYSAEAALASLQGAQGELHSIQRRREGIGDSSGGN